MALTSLVSIPHHAAGESKAYAPTGKKLDMGASALAPIEVNYESSEIFNVPEAVSAASL